MSTSDMETHCQRFKLSDTMQKEVSLTFVPDQPNRNAASCASSSPSPSIKPLTKGSSKLIAAPLSRPQNVGGVYSISGELEDDGGEGESSLLDDE